MSVTMPLYRVGDRVTTKDGLIGTVADIDTGYSVVMYLLEFVDGGGGWAMENELRPA